ncbi:MAG: hypothetical protein IIW54_04480 [Lachnospiraceae bacterium]|nr:hypothetical protein [Lachnospiraceae bacterium]
MDLSELKGKAAYAQVKKYILNEYGLKVSSLYIVQVKKKCGIETGENHNLPKSEDARQPQVTPDCARFYDEYIIARLGSIKTKEEQV